MSPLSPARESLPRSPGGWRQLRTTGGDDSRVSVVVVRHWLMKSEPDVFGIEDLRRKKTEHWDGVRNFQARNYMREMEVGDRVLFYHSNAKEIGVAGLARVAKTAYPDHTSWDPDSKYFDPRSTVEAPRWFMVDVAFVEAFPRIVTLGEIREQAALADMPLVNRSRLSVQPVTDEQFKLIVAMASMPGPRPATE